jgi:RNA polymerase sigma-70 factor (family 1)
MPDKINDLWPDDTLLALIKLGDRDAFAAIYNKYWSKLYVSAFNMLRDAQACEDIVQDILVHLWLKRKTVNIASLPAYLHTAVRYQVFTLIKSSKAHSFPLGNFEELASTDNLDDLLAEKDLRYLLNERVLTLPEKCREVFLLSRNSHLTNREIAAMLNIAPKTVENQLTIALRRLRVSMKDFLCWALITVCFLG